MLPSGFTVRTAPWIAPWTALCLIGCGMFYGYEEKGVFLSPNGALAARYVVESGNATTDFTTVVYVTLSSARVPPPRDSDRSLVFLGNGDQSLDIRWIDNERLSIECNESKRIQIRRARSESVAVEYLGCSEAIRSWEK
jgi:hypothetical protein